MLLKGCVFTLNLCSLCSVSLTLLIVISKQIMRNSHGVASGNSGENIGLKLEGESG